LKNMPDHGERYETCWNLTTWKICLIRVRVRHIFQVVRLWIYTQSNITSITLTCLRQNICMITYAFDLDFVYFCSYSWSEKDNRGSDLTSATTTFPGLVRIWLVNRIYKTDLIG
jgi:hypothetical protein